MSANTKIEWATHTFNPWEGCQKAGPGCDLCYAEARNKRFGGGVAVNWGPGAPRRRTSEANWRKPLAWNAAHEAFFAEHGYRQRVFCASLADVFDNEVPQQWRYDLFNLILSTPSLDWLLLTKRIGNAARMIKDTLPASMKALPPECPVSWPWPTVWIGATIVNQEEADRDIHKLLAVPAAKRFLSIEPMLGPIDLTRWLEMGGLNTDNGLSNRGLDWVIAGGESGPGARPSHPDWFRSLRDQCAAASVPFLFKQWGEWAPGIDVDILNAGNKEGLMRGGKHVCITPAGKPPTHGERAHMLERIGKKAAGRLLDGVTHDGFPS